MRFTESYISTEELENLRDEEGFINLDDLNIDEDSRNQMGFEDRLKYWINFKGQKALLKGERKLQGERNFGIYSELLMTELARQLGLQVAKCDLVKYKDQRGILSYLAFEYGEETLETLHGVIGETEVYKDFEDVCDYEEVETKLAKILRKDFDLSRENVMSIITERRKQKILQLFAYEADGHLENEGIIIGRRQKLKSTDELNGAKAGDVADTIEVKIAPMFDNEASFLFDCSEGVLEDLKQANDGDNIYSRLIRQKCLQIRNGETFESIEKDRDFKELMLELSNISAKQIAKNIAGNNSLREALSGVAGKVVYLEEDEYPYETINDRTLAYILDLEEESELSDFFNQIINTDMQNIVKNVENQIKAPLPLTVKEMFLTFVEMRKQDLRDIMVGQQYYDKYMKLAEVLKKMAERFAIQEKRQ